MMFDFFLHKFAACSKPPSKDIIIVKHRIEGSKNVTRVQIKLRSRNQGDLPQYRTYSMTDYQVTNHSDLPAAPAPIIAIRWIPVILINLKAK